ncbi:TetR/AcrR family transcriptional regulator [Nocardioides sp. GY 10127]|uniref:TetR/AcrR family transcriptional regulator n=1 Tax=Nocardioides sp. GY 10127 TaxID=2569762 RepID=UPI0010A861AE|nr:TetR/AcrR family transcriptional regulator [Nocardioides sp. GY 10127]TIC80004.1 TetR/AcrR family transcriptional regulator [Nocardioides sp. GY 10127]
MTSSPTPPAALQERSRRTRRALLDAGFGLLTEGGPEALTIAAVSSRAGVATGTVYRRFGDRDGLLTGLQEEFTTEFREDFSHRMSASRLRSGAAPAEAVEVAVRALADTFRSHATLLRVFVVLGLADERVAATGARASHEGGRELRALLEPYLDAFTGPDPEHDVDVAHRLVYAACMHRVVHGPQAESPRELTWEQLTDELVRTARLLLLGPAQT